MSERIAEFDEMDDAWLFAKTKNRLCGNDEYTVCAGIRRAYAVMPKIHYTVDPDEAYEDFREDENERTD